MQIFFCVGDENEYRELYFAKIKKEKERKTLITNGRKKNRKDKKQTKISKNRKNPNKEK